ncbi:aminoglycoside phosphotransferase family protein [Streptomyces sp. MA15]|uniref:phosphotransferase family protein n=1 Tax=Streptomyces sp. MA15 TaxID=3055061 RepID=UPI0025B1D94D|nr:aminoglycoside phosphotransferase family protein [Streptomyces sp. MA15]MDN3266862.1 aminoglycoside phosphotransferase family protein [Streptomyces sp. MA15]
MEDSRERARRVLAGAGLPPDALAGVRPLTGGTYNTVEEILLTDGTRYVLKVPPPPGVPGLRHERRLLVAEAAFCAGAEQARVPAPRAVSLAPDDTAPHLLMTACPGVPWPEADPTDEERTGLRTELGRQVARLHRVTGTAFGHPSGALGPLAPDWRSAFTTMTGAVLADARDHRPWLPRPVDEVAAVLRAAAPALDAVGVPVLVHFDLWPGNILVDRPADGPARIGGLIDGERMFWGDPLADFVSLALLGDIRRDDAFLAGYAEEGGPAALDGSARLRLALYRAYLDLIMLTETVPRAVGAEDARRVRESVGPHLAATLDEITALSTCAS